MRWRVQLGINSTSDVWKFCQNAGKEETPAQMAMTNLFSPIKDD